MIIDTFITHLLHHEVLWPIELKLILASEPLAYTHHKEDNIKVKALENCLSECLTIIYEKLSK